jgi:serine/threonine protein kinase
VYQGTVRAAQSAPLLTVAVKTREDVVAEKEERMLIEARLLHIAVHPRIVRLLHVVSQTLPCMLCLEYMSNGDLKTYLRACRPSLAQPKQILSSSDFVITLAAVCDALAFLHGLRLLHRDVAARNVLVDDRGLPHGAKLSDLGSAHSLADRDYYRKLGAAEMPVRWMPPEALRAGIFTAQGDIWSFGVLAFEV